MGCVCVCAAATLPQHSTKRQKAGEASEVCIQTDLICPRAERITCASFRQRLILISNSGSAHSHTHSHTHSHSHSHTHSRSHPCCSWQAVSQSGSQAVGPARAEIARRNLFESLGMHLPLIFILSSLSGNGSSSSGSHSRRFAVTE